MLPRSMPWQSQCRYTGYLEDTKSVTKDHYPRTSCQQKKQLKTKKRERERKECANMFILVSKALSIQNPLSPISVQAITNLSVRQQTSQSHDLTYKVAMPSITAWQTNEHGSLLWDFTKIFSREFSVISLPPAAASPGTRQSPSE